MQIVIYFYFDLIFDYTTIKLLRFFSWNNINNNNIVEKLISIVNDLVYAFGCDLVYMLCLWPVGTTNN